MTHAELQGILGSNINRYRQFQGLTVERLAELSEVSVGHLMDIMHGRKWIGSELLVRISSTLAVPVHVLLLPEAQAEAPIHHAMSELGNDLATKINDLILQTTKAHLKKLSD
jgi:transcriptional regulator with XRE-family HTH domain